jgi:hypothetical protein
MFRTDVFDLNDDTLYCTPVFSLCDEFYLRTVASMWTGTIVDSHCYKEWPRIASLHQWSRIPLLPLTPFLHLLPCERQCGVENTFGILVYSNEYTFPVFLFILPSTPGYSNWCVPFSSLPFVAHALPISHPPLNFNILVIFIVDNKLWRSSSCSFPQLPAI